MGRLAGLGGEPLEMRARTLPEAEARERLSAELEETKAEAVPPAVAAPLHEPVALEHHEQAVDRALVQPQALGDLEQRQVFVARQGFEDRHGAVEDLDLIGRPLRLRRHAAQYDSASPAVHAAERHGFTRRSEEHTSE